MTRLHPYAGFHALLPDGRSVFDNAFVWPGRIAPTIVTNGAGVSVIGSMFDRPNTPTVKGIMVPGLAPATGGVPTKIDDGFIVNDESDFLTAMFCDMDNNINTSYPLLARLLRQEDPHGAETLVAIVRWGLKSKVRISDAQSGGFGMTFVKPASVFYPPGATATAAQIKAWNDVKAQYDSAFTPAATILATPARSDQWVVEFFTP